MSVGAPFIYYEVQENIDFKVNPIVMIHHLKSGKTFEFESYGESAFKVCGDLLSDRINYPPYFQVRFRNISECLR